jgi:hypothetical protein
MILRELGTVIGRGKGREIGMLGDVVVGNCLLVVTLILRGGGQRGILGLLTLISKSRYVMFSEGSS